MTFHGLQDKIAIATGGAGAAQAKRLVAEGVRVAITNVLEEEGWSLAAELVER